MDSNYETWPKDRLINKIYDLEAMVASLKGVNSDSRVLLIKDRFKVTLSQARLLASLADGRMHSKRGIYEFVYHDDFDNPPEMRIIDVFMSNVRKKVRPYGLAIETVHGAGYRLNDAGLMEKVLAGEISAQEPANDGKAIRDRGANDQAVMKVLIAAMDTSGKAEMSARVIAREASLKVRLSPIMDRLESSGKIRVRSRPDRSKGRGNWVVQVKARAL